MKKYVNFFFNITKIIYLKINFKRNKNQDKKFFLQKMLNCMNEWKSNGLTSRKKKLKNESNLIKGQK